MRTTYYYGYNIVAAGFIIQAWSIGAMFTYGVFFKQFQAELGWSRALISGAPSLAFLVMGAVGILAGRLNDRIGPKILIVVSGVSLGIGYLLMSRLQAPRQLYLFYGVLVGIGLSTHDVITLSTVTRWFVRRRGMMTGIVKVGTGAGQLLVPLAATALVTFYGWRNAYLIIGSLALLILVAVALVLRRDPQAIGLLPDGGNDEPCGSKMVCAERNVLLRTAVRTRQFWTICIAQFTIFFCLLTMIVHIVPHAIELEVSPVNAANVLAILGGIGVLGNSLLGGIIGDRIGNKKAFLIGCTLMVASLFWLVPAKEVWMLYVFALSLA